MGRTLTRLSRFIAGVSALALAAPVASAADFVEYYHLDAIGNVRVVTDQNKNVIERHDYLPFGEECTTGPCANNPGVGAGQPRKFTGKERDAETGLDYFGARYYGSKIARFTTVDPVYTWRENLVDPQRWNRYAYARSNPLRYVDPDGKQTTPAILLTTTVDPPQLRDSRIDTVIGVVEGVLMLFPGLEIQANSTAQAHGQIIGQAVTLGLFGTFARGGVAAKEASAATKGETRFTAAGRRAHAEEPLPPGFERDVRLPSGKRMDAYNAAERQVIEIKPNNPRAIQRGQRQVQGYCGECDQTIGLGHTGQVQTYDPAKYLKDQ